jgi:hypothetical protein
MTIAHRLPVLLALPFVFFGAGAMTAVVATKVVTLIAPKPATLLDAAAAGDEEVIFRKVSAGEDPGLPVVLDRPLFHWQSGDVVSPLLAAIVGGDPNEIAYLVQATRRWAEPPNDRALCVAARHDNGSAARYLMKIGAPAVPKEGCGEAQKPEDVAAKYGASGLARELRQYRLKDGAERD